MGVIFVAYGAKNGQKSVLILGPIFGGFFVKHEKIPDRKVKKGITAR